MEGKQIEIGGITYLVVGRKSFVHNGATREELKLRRPNGRRMYFVTVYENGDLSSVV